MVFLEAGSLTKRVFTNPPERRLPITSSRRTSFFTPCLRWGKETGIEEELIEEGEAEED